MNFTLTALDVPREDIQDIRDAVLATPFTNPELSANHLIVDGITVQKDIPVFGRGGLTMTDGPGCEPTPVDPTYPTVAKKSWEPNRVGYRLEFCETDFSKFFAYMKADGVNKADLTQADFWGWLVAYLGENHEQELARKIWFDDKDINWTGGASPAGTLNAAAKVAYYNQINGLFKQMFALGTSDAAVYTNIPANTSSSQELTGAEAFSVFNTIVKNAGIRLMANKADLRFNVTDSVARALAAYMRSQAVDSSFQRITQDGTSGLAFDGIPIISNPNWDITIQNDFTTGGVKDLPHRIVLTYPNNIPVGTETESNLLDMEIFYDKKDRKAYLDVFMHLDAKVYLDDEVHIAY